MSLGLRQEAFSLLNKLCQDSLEVPLALVLQHPDGEIGDAFARLFDIVEQLSGENERMRTALQTIVTTTKLGGAADIARRALGSEFVK